MRYYKFVSWDVPPVEKCFSASIPAALLEWDKGNKQPLKNLHIATQDPIYKILGWAFPYTEYLRRYWVKTKYHGIIEMYALNKTDIRKELKSGVVRIVEVTQ